MKKNKKYIIILIFTLFIISFLIPMENAFASYHYKEWNDEITLSKDGTINVTENLSIYFGSHDGGTAYHWFERWIDLNQIQNITDVEVFENVNGTLIPYERSSNGTLETFSVRTKNNSFYIKLNYEAKNTVKHFVIKYQILGATKLGTVAFYEDDASFNYIAIPSKNEVSIDKAIVTVHIPDGALKEEIKAWGAGLPIGSGNVTIVNGNEITLTGSELAPGEFIEFYIAFPRGLVEEPPGITIYPGSARDKAQQQAEAATREAKIAGLKTLLGFLLFIIIVLWIFLTWYKKGKDIILPKYAEYIKDPPSDLPPAVVGALLKQGATLKEVIATILDLADREYIKIEEVNEVFRKNDYIYKRTDKDTSTLNAYEQTLMRYVFEELNSIHLSDLKYEFSKYLHKIYSKINRELVSNEFYEGGSPAKVKGKYIGIAIFMIILGSIFLFAIGTSLGVRFLAWPLIPGGIIVLFFAPAMPRKSMKGAKERMKWLAFKKYLEGLVKYKKAEEAQNLFSQYLPFAVVFDIDKHWIKEFSRANTPAPVWYIPYHRAGYGYSNTGGLSSAKGFGGTSNNIANSMKGFSLDSISHGLNSLLNSSATVFTASKSSSGGGGGFSGGGGFGGGGGGGSSAG
ncbi:MAG: DUF2207 domain-containing protein [Caldisericota bacterium]|nr:DUF2207 domain-containing protein [Caldisericota bacterium]